MRLAAPAMEWGVTVGERDTIPYPYRYAGGTRLEWRRASAGQISEPAACWNDG